MFGINGDDFQKVFADTMKDMNLKYEKSMTSVKIIEPELEFYISLQSWIGGGQIRLRSKTNHELFLRIIREVKSKEIKPNYIQPVSFLFF